MSVIVGPPPFPRDKLHVIVTHFNPMRWKIPTKVRLEFIEHMLGFQNVHLTVVECALGERDFEINLTDGAHSLIQVRCNSLIWQKENLLNWLELLCVLKTQ